MVPSLVSNSLICPVQSLPIYFVSLLVHSYRGRITYADIVNGTKARKRDSCTWQKNQLGDPLFDGEECPSTRWQSEPLVTIPECTKAAPCCSFSGEYMKYIIYCIYILYYIYIIYCILFSVLCATSSKGKVIHISLNPGEIQASHTQYIVKLLFAGIPSVSQAKRCHPKMLIQSSL